MPNQEQGVEAEGVFRSIEEIRRTFFPNSCPHCGGMDSVDGGRVEIGMHGTRFCLRCKQFWGKPNNPAKDALRAFRTALPQSQGAKE